MAATTGLPETRGASHKEGFEVDNSWQNIVSNGGPGLSKYHVRFRHGQGTMMGGTQVGY